MSNKEMYEAMFKNLNSSMSRRGQLAKEFFEKDLRDGLSVRRKAKDAVEKADALLSALEEAGEYQ